MADWQSVPVSTVQRLTVAVIVAVLLVSSPVAGLVDLTPPSRSPNMIGDGTATVRDASVPADRVRMTHGRFGTDVTYLRFPPATADIASVTGRPQLVYVARVPGLDFERIVRKQLGPGTRGPTTVRMDARAFAPRQTVNRTYRVELVLRVQSFEVNEVLYRRNTTVTVPARDR